MKVYIGPYRRWIGPYHLADMVFFVKRHGIYEDSKNETWRYRTAEKFGDWLADTWVNDFCLWVDKKKKRKIKVKLHNYDTWNLDYTLALIILPCLKQLKETNHGCAMTDPEDAPTIGKGEETDFGHSDTKIYERWDWIMDEMIWSFEQIIEDDETSFYNSETKTFDREGLLKRDERINNGLRLFGKYYRALWD